MSRETVDGHKFCTTWDLQTLQICNRVCALSTGLRNSMKFVHQQYLWTTAVACIPEVKARMVQNRNFSKCPLLKEYGDVGPINLAIPRLYLNKLVVFPMLHHGLGSRWWGHEYRQTTLRYSELKQTFLEFEYLNTPWYNWWHSNSTQHQIVLDHQHHQQPFHHCHRSISYIYTTLTMAMATLLGTPNASRSGRTCC